MSNYNIIRNPSIVRDGLRILYDFSDVNSYRPGETTTIYDLSGNGFNGTVSLANGGGVGIYGGVKSLDKTGTYGSDKPIDSGNAPIVSGDFSVAIWVRNGRTEAQRDADTQGRTMVSTYDYQGGAGAVDTGWGIGNSWVDTDPPFFWACDGSSFNTNDNMVTWSEPGSIGSNQWFDDWFEKWVMLTATYDSVAQSGSIYQDGILQSATSSSWGTLSGQNDNLIWGARSAENQSNWDGQIAYCMYYNKVLSPTEVKRNYDVLKTRFGK